jgi:hypothetical protein
LLELLTKQGLGRAIRGEERESRLLPTRLLSMSRGTRTSRLSMGVSDSSGSSLMTWILAFARVIENFLCNAWGGQTWSIHETVAASAAGDPLLPLRPCPPRATSCTHLRCAFGNVMSARGAPSTRSGLDAAFPSPPAPAPFFAPPFIPPNPFMSLFMSPMAPG